MRGVLIGIFVDAVLAVFRQLDSCRRHHCSQRGGDCRVRRYRLGPDSRDGLMTGLLRRTNGSMRLVRTVIQTVVITTSWAFGGTTGIAHRAPRPHNRWWLFKDYQLPV